MSKLETDTRLTDIDCSDQTTKRFTAELHPDWCVWFPHGGYMAAILLRAAGRSSDFERPLSFSCHYLSVPAMGAVEVSVSSLRKSRYAESLRVTMLQGEKVIIEALIWTAATIDGYSHDDAVMPEVPSAHELKSTTEIPGGHAEHPFWNNIEQRPVSGDLHWQQEEPGPAVQRDWIRFIPDALDDDPYLNMARYAVLLDGYTWPSAARAHVGDNRFIAPTMSLSIDFHRDYSGSWILSDATAPVAKSGYIACRNRLWSEQGELLASANATLMCRPRPS